MAYSEDVRVCNGIDWWWGRSLVRGLNFLRAQRPGVLVLEWWTAATLHTYLVLAVVARDPQAYASLSSCTNFRIRAKPA